MKRIVFLLVEICHYANTFLGKLVFLSQRMLTDVYRNWKTHGNVYLQKCKALEIEPVDAAQPVPCEDIESLEASATQPSLDGFVKSTSKWSKEELLEHIVDFVVSGDQVCSSIIPFVV